MCLLDQRHLPGTVEYVCCDDPYAVASAIKEMVVRGAPAIGIAAGYGVALAFLRCSTSGESLEYLQETAEALLRARPTAVNLRWAVERVMKKGLEGLSKGGASLGWETAEREARSIEVEDLAINRKIGEVGAKLIDKRSSVLTHCNAGALATGGYGTALGVIRKAWEEGKIDAVYACETRPFLQGARLTAWELLQDGIDVTVLVDSAAGYLMSLGRIDCVIVGADRIARSGDTANKIGTYALACLAKSHSIPFYVAAPLSTFDLSLDEGGDIPIEERPGEEVLFFRGLRIGPDNVGVFNPSFDVTPASLISGIITEEGVLTPPFVGHHEQRGRRGNE